MGEVPGATKMCPNSIYSLCIINSIEFDQGVILYMVLSGSVDRNVVGCCDLCGAPVRPSPPLLWCFLYSVLKNQSIDLSTVALLTWTHLTPLYTLYFVALLKCLCVVRRDARRFAAARGSPADTVEEQICLRIHLLSFYIFYICMKSWLQHTQYIFVSRLKHASKDGFKNIFLKKRGLFALHDSEVTFSFCILQLKLLRPAAPSSLSWVIFSYLLVFIYIFDNRTYSGIYPVDFN